MGRRRKATGSGRDPSRQRNSTSTTGVFHPIREDAHNEAMLVARGLRDGSAGTRIAHDLVFESGHEQDCLIVLDIQPGVDRLETQPETWRLKSGRRYTPDIKISGATRRVGYVEVKPLRFIERDPTLAGRREEIEKEAAERDVDFIVLSEDTYRAGARLENAHLLRHSARRDLPAARARVLEVMERNRSGLPLRDIVLELRMGPEGRFAVLGLVALGILAIDLDERIRPDSIVRWPENVDG